MKLRLHCLALVLVFGLLPPLQAHGPFDNSSQLIVHDDTFELGVTMGMDGSRQFLKNAGLPEADAANALTGRGPSTVLALSVDLAPKFFAVDVDGRALAASGVTVITDGLEAAFMVAYPRPASGELRLRALYFNGIAEMKPGSFIATDEDRNALGAALITRAKPEVTIQLPATTNVVLVVPETAKTAEQEAPLARVAAAQEAVASPGAHGAPAGRFIWIAVLAPACLLLWLVLRKLTRSR